MKNRVDYDDVAPVYDQRYAQHEYPGTTQALHEAVAHGMRVLEIGCGTGHWLQQLEAWGCEASGLDASSEMLRRARERQLRAALVQGSASALPWPEASFDRVVCINALHHFPEPARTLREAARVLRPGGRLFSVGLDPSVTREAWFVYDYFERTRALDEARYVPTRILRQWLEQAGFAGCSTHCVERIQFDHSARATLASGMLSQKATSQLLLLSREEYQRGVALIERDIAEAEALGRDLRLRSDLRLYVTTASMPNKRCDGACPM